MASATLSRHGVASSVAVLSGAKLVQRSGRSRVRATGRRLATTVAAEAGTAEQRADRAVVASGDDRLEICRVINGMWQTSGGWGRIDSDDAIDAMLRYVDAGFATFDMADHCKPSTFFYQTVSSLILHFPASLILQH
jgi:hypothetical protein